MNRTLQLCVPRGMLAKGGSRVKEERDKTSRGSQDGDTITWKCSRQHLRGLCGAGIRPEEVIPEESNRQRVAQARNALAFNSKCFMWRHLCSLVA